MTPPQWTRVATVDELPAGGGRVKKVGGAQLALFRMADGAVHVVDNRCPHEGYPLAQGDVKGCVLTCAWHNFKFDLRDGSCLLGDEAVRRYEARVVDGVVEVDLAPPDLAGEIPRLMQRLEDGVVDRRLGQVARDVVRLLAAGVPPETLALLAARIDAERAEYGTTHVLPVVADVVLHYLPRHRGDAAALPLMQALEMAADFHVRRAPRPTPPAIDPGEDPAAAGARLAALVEAEEAEEAEALLRGALAKGWGPQFVGPWLCDIASAHFLDFGHALIFHVRMFELLERVGWEHAAALLPAHLYAIVVGTREDTLPPWTALRRRVDELTPRFAELLAIHDGPPPPGWSDDALVGALLDGALNDAVDTVVAALEGGAGLDAVIDALSVAASERILRFDPAIDRDPMVREGWLHTTHLLTTVQALRQVAARWPGPRVMRLVLFAVRFVNHEAPLDLTPELRPNLGAAAGPAPDVPDILAAIRARDAARALALAARYLADGRRVAPLAHAFANLPLDDVATRPIVVAHLMKTAVAAHQETRALRSHPRAAWPMLAVVRLAASPIRERAIGRTTHEAVRFVVDGQVPRHLAT